MYKRIIILCLPIGFCLASLSSPKIPIAWALQGTRAFQGMIELREQDNTTQRTANIYFKWGFSRFEYRDKRDEEFTVIDFDNRIVYTVMPTIKSYIASPIEPVANIEMDDYSALKSTQTGKRTTIAGYTCELWILQSASKGDFEEDDDGKIEIWASREPVSLIEVQKMQVEMGQPILNAWSQWAATQGVFPFKVIRYGPDMEEEYRIEITNIQRKSLDASLFRIPKGFKEL